jgi:hypothetical protein
VQASNSSLGRLRKRTADEAIKKAVGCASPTVAVA